MVKPSERIEQIQKEIIDARPNGSWGQILSKSEAICRYLDEEYERLSKPVTSYEPSPEDGE